MTRFSDTAVIDMTIGDLKKDLFFRDEEVLVFIFKGIDSISDLPRPGQGSFEPIADLQKCYLVKGE